MGVCERTVHRDLAVLREADIACDYAADRGGYVLRGDWRFAVKWLSDEELLGQAIATALTSARGLDIGPGAAPTTRKLRATARESARRLLEDAERVISVLDLKLAEHGGHREVFRAAQHALIKKLRLEGTYASPHQARVKRLILHPIRLCLVKQAWYLIARPDTSTDPATYRVARFRSLKALDQAADVPEEFDLRAYFGDAWAVYRANRSHEVELRFAPEAAALVMETTWHHTQRVVKNEDASATLSFRVDGLEEIVWWVLGWSAAVQVVRPLELRQMVVERLRRALTLNELPGPP
jgi:predicted DNA-binding transcriptional regulator YafY